MASTLKHYMCSQVKDQNKRYIKNNSYIKAKKGADQCSTRLF